MGGRSRGGALGALLDRMARDRLEWANGRLRFTSGTWRFVGATYGKPRADGFMPTGKCHTTGRDMELVICKGVFCPNPEMGGKYPMITDPPKSPTWHVPDSACQKCPHRGKKGENRLPYPHCKWAKQERGGPAGAAKSLLTTINQAVNDARDVIK